MIIQELLIKEFQGDLSNFFFISIIWSHNYKHQNGKTERERYKEKERLDSKAELMAQFCLVKENNLK